MAGLFLYTSLNSQISELLRNTIGWRVNEKVNFHYKQAQLHFKMKLYVVKTIQLFKFCHFDKFARWYVAIAMRIYTRAE